MGKANAVGPTSIEGCFLVALCIRYDTNTIQNIWSTLKKRLYTVATDRLNTRHGNQTEKSGKALKTDLFSCDSYIPTGAIISNLLSIFEEKLLLVPVPVSSMQLKMSSRSPMNQVARLDSIDLTAKV